MEKKKTNLTIIGITIVIIIFIIIMATIIKINDNHRDKLIYSMHSKVEYYAKRCYLENNCKDEIILKDLYDKNYLEPVVDPITKEIVDENLKINYKDNNIIINWD